VLTAIACAPILAGWLAVHAHRYLSGRRERRENAEWAQLAAGLAELDADLDRTWAAEQERMRRYR
jgi:hypothetical protein